MSDRIRRDQVDLDPDDENTLPGEGQDTEIDDIPAALEEEDEELEDKM